MSSSTTDAAAADISDEARALIQSEHDLYALLGITPTADAGAIKSAWRKTSLKYHPDKNRDNPAAVETFYLAKNAAELLGSPAARAEYDRARAGRAQREAAAERLEGRRRAMMEELERAERGAKRKREGEVGEKEMLERELKRLARDGERRRREREEARAREREEEARREEEGRRERERERRRQSVGAQFQGGTPVKGAAERRFEGVRGGPVGSMSAPSTPAGKGKKAFSFSPKVGAGGVGNNRFEQDTLARLKAKQAEKRRLEEQIRAAEGEADAAS